MANNINWILEWGSRLLRIIYPTNGSNIKFEYSKRKEKIKYPKSVDTQEYDLYNFCSFVKRFCVALFYIKKQNYVKFLKS